MSITADTQFCFVISCSVIYIDLYDCRDWASVVIDILKQLPMYSRLSVPTFIQ